MATVTIRNLDDEVVRQLKERARLHNRSLEAELREVLTRTATAAGKLKSLRREAERIAATTAGRVHSDSTDLVREDRDR